MPGYFPIADGPYRLAMGLQKLRLEDWIEIDAAFADDLREKRRLLAARHDEVFQALPASGPGQTEVLHLLAEHLPRHHPQTHRRDGNRLLVKPLDQWFELSGANARPLETASRLVQEDLCLMEPVGEAYHLTAASVCFPTRWNLLTKIGRPLADIHAPVPGYAEKLERPMDRFFSLLNEAKPVQRLNWSLMDDPALFQPKGHGRTARDDTITAENAGERLWLRVERQTLRRLPKTGGILFTIRIHTNPLSEVAAEPDRAERMLAALRSMPSGMRGYKSMPVFGAAVERYLENRSGLV